MTGGGAGHACHPAPVRLVCIDVDGTLVGSSGVVSPAVWQAAQRVRASGIRLAICSGRPGFGVSRSYAERLDATGWHSFQNGASVVQLPSGHSVSTPLTESTVELLVTRARSTGRLLELYGDVDYAFEVDSAEARAHADLLGVDYAPRPFGDLTGPVIRAQWVISDAEAAIVVAEPHPGLELSVSTSPVMPETQFFNLTLEGVNKGTAVRSLASQYGLSLNELMFVGDGPNDVPAMRIVGRPVAMANAAPEVRAAATVTVPHVDDGGLIHALAKAVEAAAEVR